MDVKHQKSLQSPRDTVADHRNKGQPSFGAYFLGSGILSDLEEF